MHPYDPGFEKFHAGKPRCLLVFIGERRDGPRQRRFHFLRVTPEELAAGTPPRQTAPLVFTVSNPMRFAPPGKAGVFIETGDDRYVYDYSKEVPEWPQDSPCLQSWEQLHADSLAALAVDREKVPLLTARVEVRKQVWLGVGKPVQEEKPYFLTLPAHVTAKRIQLHFESADPKAEKKALTLRLQEHRGSASALVHEGDQTLILKISRPELKALRERAVELGHIKAVRSYR